LIGEYFCLLDRDDSEAIQVTLFDSKRQRMGLDYPGVYRQRQASLRELLAAEPESFAGAVSTFLRV
jgi:hypothetical protein